MNEQYDEGTYVHWLFWRLRCLEASGQDFQKLFEDVSARAEDKFVRIRAYGNLGDRKCDGLYWGDGTVYQVYSPDEMKEAETRAKIEEDLTGAIEHWGVELKRWVFVYNVRRGIPPDVAKLLQKHSRVHKDVTIEPLSDDDLWKIVRQLPVQDRVEILGPPPNYKALFPLRMSMPDNIQQRLDEGRFVVVHDVLAPINLEDALRAIEPACPFAPPLFVRPPTDSDAWELAAEYQTGTIADALSRSRDKLPRFAVFSLSPIPLAVHLGFQLSDRVEVEPYQFDRDRKTWLWGESTGDALPGVHVQGLPTAASEEIRDASIRVSISAGIRPEDTIAVTGGGCVEVDIRAKKPDAMWLVSATQLTELAKAFRSVLAQLREKAPNLQRIHLFYAGPTGGAIVIGQMINPRMNPPVLLYEYDRGQRPRYRRVLTLE